MTAAAALLPFLAPPLRPGSLQLQCPACARPLGTLHLRTPEHAQPRVCPRCHFTLHCVDGIWRALPPAREEHFSSFIADYEFIRKAEGRGSQSSDYYLALPDHDLTGKNSRQWAIRARTFRYLCKHILPRLAARHTRSLRILDLGAGNGWLSARLAELGHAPTAVDLLTNPTDGLAAAEHFRAILPHLFPRVQAEHDHLPFVAASFDLVIFNASFHYSEDYERTLREALRVLAPGGSILIADTPWYASDEQGHAMVAERRRNFALRFGIPSDSLSSLEYLTDHRLWQLTTALHLSWRIHAPSYGIHWALRPLLAKIRRRREPSRFYLYLARPAAA